jgi:ubiquinone/menaquinone biosynthesis C-methylase UbiE
MNKTLGQTLRPGGFTLTEKSLQFCKLSKYDNVLDLGCGKGATLNYLYEKHQIKGKGIDPSYKLLDIARKNNPFAEFIEGTGNDLPFKDRSFNAVFAECTLSLMESLSTTIKEVFRVLYPEGWFIVTDVYARNISAVNELNDVPFGSCMRGLHDLEYLKDNLKNNGFQVMLLEDCSDLLKQLMVKIIFEYGSMDVFWNKATDHCDKSSEKSFQQRLNACKPGYFILIAKKGEM